MTHLDVWVIFARPADFPDVPFIVRLQRTTGHGIEHQADAWSAQTIESARALIQANAPGTVRFERSPDDDPVIVESWL